MRKSKWWWFLGGIGLAVTPLQAAGRTVLVYPPGHDELEEIRLEIAIDGKVAGKLQAKVSDSGPEPTVRIAVGDGFHRYALTGEARFSGGLRRPLHGEGFLAQAEFLSARLEKEKRDPLGALEGLLRELRAFPGAPSLPRLERGPRVSVASALAELEGSKEIRLPAYLGPFLERFGPFAYISLGDEGEEPRAALYAPTRILSVPEWRREIRRAPLEPGDTPKAKKRLAEMQRDLVLGHAFDTVWTLRAGSHPRCPGGAVSLSGEYLYENDPAEDLWHEGTDAHESYFGDREPRCDDRTEMLMANYLAAFVDGFEDVLAVSQDGSIRLQFAIDESTSGPLALSFGE